MPHADWTFFSEPTVSCCLKHGLPRTCCAVHPHSVRRAPRVAALFATSFFSLAVAATGQEVVIQDLPRPVLAALPLSTDEAPIVDGILDDAAWERADRGGDFMQREPQDGIPASQRTEFQVAFTPSALYVAGRVYDTDPDLIIAKEMGRDSGIRNDDGFSFILDTFLDRRNGFFFETNPNGAKSDALITDEGANSNFEWDGVWKVRSRVTSDGWVTEFEIPFSTLRFDPSQSSWGMQVSRSVRRHNESTYWAPLPQQFNGFRISSAGTIEGLSGLEPSQQLDIKPFVVASSTQSRELGNSDDADVGLDLKWGITKSMRLDATYNTDFAETEVDDQQINLTRFSLFFPEKREFFLENAGIFEFGTPTGRRGGGGGNLFKGFFSRRIGIDSEGTEAPVEWGARLTGRAGEWNLGVLSVEVDETEFDGATSFQVVRAKRNIGKRSSIGALMTRRDESGPEQNQLVGVDFSIKPTDDLNFSGYYAASDDETADGEVSDETVGLSGNYDTREWKARLNVLEIGEDFTPGVGFLRRDNIRRYESEVEYEPIINKRSIRNLRFGLQSEYISDLQGRMESREVRYSFLGLRNYQGDGMFLSVTEQTERLFEDFEISEGIVIPTGRHDADPRISLFLNSANSRALSFRLFGGTGGFFNGTRDNVSLTTTLRPNRFVRSETQIDLNKVSLPSGSFDSNLYRQRVSFNLNPKMLFNALIQYNENSDALGLNLRFNWIYRPGADLFVVFNQTWNAPNANDATREDRQIVVKFTYLFHQ